jgi:hypothetical protein
MCRYPNGVKTLVSPGKQVFTLAGAARRGGAVFLTEGSGLLIDCFVGLYFFEAIIFAFSPPPPAPTSREVAPQLKQYQVSPTCAVFAQ